MGAGINGGLVPRASDHDLFFTPDPSKETHVPGRQLCDVIKASIEAGIRAHRFPQIFAIRQAKISENSVRPIQRTSPRTVRDKGIISDLPRKIPYTLPYTLSICPILLC
jgi:hypothetical protein